MLAELVNTTPVVYLGNDLKPVWRPCRTWGMGEHHVTAVVTETNDPTMSIETAAAAIRTTLEWFWAPCRVTIIEHWPAGVGCNRSEHYAEQYVHQGRIAWRHVDAQTLRQQLAEFEVTKPSAVPLYGLRR